jgi:hypothetical protein
VAGSAAVLSGSAVVRPATSTSVWQRRHCCRKMSSVGVTVAAGNVAFRRPDRRPAVSVAVAEDSVAVLFVTRSLAFKVWMTVANGRWVAQSAKRKCERRRLYIIATP